MIAAGSLNRSLSIYCQAPTRSPTGAETSAWVKLTTTWAAQKSLTLKETTRMAGVAEAAEAKFEVRYRTGIDTTMQVECGGRRFSIIAVNEIGNREGLALLVRAI